MAYQGGTSQTAAPSIAEWLQASACKIAGLALLAACGLASVCLITWSIGDPSLAHTASGATRNLLGPVGAVISDLLMQMLGLAAPLLLLPPAFWSLEMITRGKLDKARPKIAMAPAAVVLLAGAIAALPVAAGWPLSHGMGGFLGDKALKAGIGLTGFINPATAPAASGLFFFAGGLMLLISSLGLTQQDIRMILDFDVRGTLVACARVVRGIADVARARGEPLLTPIVRKTEPQPTAATMERHEPVFMAAPALHEAEPFLNPPTAIMPRPASAAQAPLHAAERLEPHFGTDRAGEPHFDHTTEHESVSIARRFAPGGMDMAQANHAMPAVELLPDTLHEAAHAEPQPAPPAVAADPYARPQVSLLRRPANAKPGPDVAPAALAERARMLVEVLSDFGVRGEIKEINPGPVVTLFEFEPARGVKSSRVINLAEDIARAMSAQSVRVAVVQGRNAIGIEMPNARRETVVLRELIETEAFATTEAALPLVLGKTISGTPVFSDLARMPHLLVAGTTGSGKSVGINTMILSLVYKMSPQQCRMIMIDPKMLELSVYNGIPHLLCPVVTEPQAAVNALNWVVGEMEERYRRMAKLAVRNIDAFNARLKDEARQLGGDADLVHMPYIVVVIDEFADLMMVAGKEVEFAVQRLAQKARAAGIHLIMATQRPSVDVITGTIKANFPTRISFKVASKFDSRTILNEQGAEHLLGQGDMLFWGGNGRSLRVHGPFVADEEVEAISRFLAAQGAPQYVTGITEAPEEAEADGAGDGEARGEGDADLYARAVRLVVEDGKASTSYIQRRLGIGYNRAADLIERMEDEGLIGPAGPQGRRPILRPGP
ncbi:MAG: DNA translocase FtsK 4TM domain-containing protein [Hyphomicrobiaceae bacterium]|nr:DNA translocase FtsK 4TM domain-containing protein [Hyphomicrobiaceae bacterium]